MASCLISTLAFPLCVCNIDVQELRAAKLHIKACFPLENSPRLSVAQSMWVATPLPSHLHLKGIRGTCSSWRYPHVYRQRSSNCSKPTPETRFHPRCLHHVLSFCAVSRSVSVQSQAAAMCGQVGRSKAFDDVWKLGDKILIWPNSSFSLKSILHPNFLRNGKKQQCSILLLKVKAAKWTTGQTASLHIWFYRSFMAWSKKLDLRINSRRKQGTSHVTE